MMRKIVMLFGVVWLLILPITAFAERYFSVGGGGGGKADAPSLTLELGEVSTNREYKCLIAIGWSFIFNADDVPSDTLEYPVPHSDYTNLGRRQKDNEHALFGKCGLEVKKQGAFIFALAGLSSSKEIDLARSNVTGWYYEQSSSSKVNGMFGGGLSYFSINSKVFLSVEYDNRRGITGSLGFRF